MELMNFTGTTDPVQHSPEMPVALLPWAAMIPETWVPWPLSSAPESLALDQVHAVVVVDVAVVVVVLVVSGSLLRVAPDVPREVGMVVLRAGVEHGDLGAGGADAPGERRADRPGAAVGECVLLVVSGVVRRGRATQVEVGLGIADAARRAQPSAEHVQREPTLAEAHDRPADVRQAPNESPAGSLDHRLLGRGCHPALETDDKLPADGVGGRCRRQDGEGAGGEHRDDGDAGRGAGHVVEARSRALVTQLDCPCDPGASPESEDMA